MPPITNIPTKFLYYKDPILMPYTRAALVEQIQVDGAFDLTCVPSTHQYQMPADSAAAVFVMTAKLRQKNGTVVSKRIYAHPTPARNVTTAEDIYLITFAGPSPIFGAYKLKTNIILHPSSSPGAVPPPIAAPAVPAALPAPVPATPKPSSKAKAGDLTLFVAKQLLELAQSKHEMCPIVAEEYAAGHTAAMPCGHLFADFAIQETFKKEPNKCPVCREYGRPTYV